MKAEPLPGTKPDEMPHKEIARNIYRQQALTEGATLVEADEYANRRIDHDDR